MNLIEKLLQLAALWAVILCVSKDHVQGGGID